MLPNKIGLRRFHQSNTTGSTTIKYRQATNQQRRSPPYTVWKLLKKQWFDRFCSIYAGKTKQSALKSSRLEHSKTLDNFTPFSGGEEWIFASTHAQYIYFSGPPFWYPGGGLCNKQNSVFICHSFYLFAPHRTEERTGSKDSVKRVWLWQLFMFFD